MSGLPDDNFPAFNIARDVCLACGYEVISPADLELNRTPRSYKEKLRDDLKHLLECDEILLLKGWKKSVGARLEWFVAVSVGIKVRYESSFR